MSQKTLTIIDTFGFFFRLYYAMSGLKNREGKPSGMVSGFASFIMNLRQEFASDSWASIKPTAPSRPPR